MSKRRWGDRRDAVLVRDIDAMHNYMTYLMPNRTEAEVCQIDTYDVTELLKYIEAKNGPDAEFKTTIFHALVMAMAKVIYMRPLLNRYISANRFYDRREISFSFVAKKRFTDHAEEALMILKPKEGETLTDISRQIVGKVHEARKEGENYGADDILKLVQKLPRFVMHLVIALLNFLDRHGWLPGFVTDVDPNFTTVLLSNLGSIKCNACYHHLNNFGTNSIMVNIGTIHKEPMVMEDGSVQVRDVVSIAAIADERIADGFYFARSLKIVRFLFEHPEWLDRPLEDVPELKL